MPFRVGPDGESIWDDDDPYGPAVPPPPPTPGAGPVVPPGPTPGEPPPDYGSYDPPAPPGAYRPNFNFGPPPVFNPTRFVAPSREEAENEPGFQFRLGQGQKALEASKAARGLLRTGGTIKEFDEYSQNFAAQEYNNVYNRQMQAYGLQYQAERDMFAPLLADYQNRFGAEQAAGLSGFDRETQLYIAALQEYSRQQDRIQNTILGGGGGGDVSAHWRNV